MSAILERASEIVKENRASELSAVLQASFEEKNFDVLRLNAKLVSVTAESQQLIFVGVSGPSTSRVAVSLCEDLPWLRRTLEVKDIPVPPTIKLPSRASNAARLYVEELGEPAKAWWQGDLNTEREFTTDTFDTAWKALVAEQPEEDPGLIVFEPTNIGEPHHVSVVFGKVLDTVEKLPERARELALRAVTVLPGASSADVTVSQRPDGSFVVSSADVLFSSWDAQPLPAHIDELAARAIEGELARVSGL